MLHIYVYSASHLITGAPSASTVLSLFPSPAPGSAGRGKASVPSLPVLGALPAASHSVVLSVESVL